MPSSGTLTDNKRDKLAQADSGTLGPDNVNAPRIRIAFFRIGEGGVKNPGVGVRLPIDVPSPSFSDIQAPAKSVYFFEKELVSGVDVTVSGNEVTVNVTVDAGEGNGPGVFPQPGGNPEFSEVGLFDEAGVMVAYFTFPPEEKIAGNPLSKTFVIKYGT